MAFGGGAGVRGGRTGVRRGFGSAVLSGWPVCGGERGCCCGAGEEIWVWVVIGGKAGGIAADVFGLRDAESGMEGVAADLGGESALVVGLWGLDQAGCSARGGSVKNSARKDVFGGFGDASSDGGVVVLAGGSELGALTVGNVLAVTESLGRPCGLSCTGSDSLGDDSSFWAATNAVACSKITDG